MRKKIIGIFIITLLTISATTTIATNINKNNYSKLKTIEPLDVPNGWLEGADQYQIENISYGFVIQPSFPCAQEFKPSKETLTAVALPFFKFGDPPSGTTITVWIRDELNGNDLATASIDTDNWRFKLNKGTWALFDFDDIETTPEESYYIVCSADKGTFDPEDSNNTNTFCWFFDVSNKYDRGIAFQSNDSGQTWPDLENPFDDPEYVECDFTFITYFQKPPKNKSTDINLFLQKIVQRFPILEKILKQII
ncbi:MAG: hypothetical protein BV457_00910 [Thermoplasmata archaeon M9B1D]|nr:MAG: hypothetical protein BV457_00910 [Thermoplasmata archaeon M9B1D]PNX50695.1 MAG: hypothetical protein BV456_05835 [Thermoplasmata archaeon M8B2D]